MQTRPLSSQTELVTEVPRRAPVCESAFLVVQPVETVAEIEDAGAEYVVELVVVPALMVVGAVVVVVVAAAAAAAAVDVVVVAVVAVVAGADLVELVQLLLVWLPVLFATDR